MAVYVYVDLRETFSFPAWVPGPFSGRSKRESRNRTIPAPVARLASANQHLPNFYPISPMLITRVLTYRQKSSGAINVGFTMLLS